MLVVTLKCNEVAKSFNLVVPDGTTFAEVWDSQQHWFNYGDRVELSTDDKEDENAQDVLRTLWEDTMNELFVEMLYDSSNPIDESKCWCEEDMAVITWNDGHTKEFYIAEVK